MFPDAHLITFTTTPEIKIYYNTSLSQLLLTAYFSTHVYLRQPCEVLRVVLLQ